MTTRFRAAGRWVAGLLALGLVAATSSGCGLVASSPQTSDGPTTLAPSAPATPVAPGAAVATTSRDVAGFDLAAHRLLRGLPSSPDRTTLTSSALPPGVADPPPGRGRQRYLSQTISWHPCGEFQCATVLVPLSWDHPDGQAITLAMKKAAATGTRRATLFVNPGGPGGSGQELVAQVAGGKHPDQDVIGWDPRGSGESTPVRCGTPAQTDAFMASVKAPRNEQQWAEAITAHREFAAQCRQASGVLLDHISTIDTVRDLDYLRFLVGDEKLHFLGISYGTFIGASYAELYPARVGRMVLDSAVNITDDDSVVQQMGFDLALRAWAGWCAAHQDECQLGGSREEVLAAVTGLFDQVGRQPLQSDGRTVTQPLVVGGVAGHLYAGGMAYPSLAAAVRDARGGNPRQLLAVADLYNGRQEDGSYGSLAYAFPAIACADAVDEGLAGSRRAWAEDNRKAPLLSPYLGPELVCPVWSAKPAPQLELVGRGAAPILVLGATGDPATPYQQAVSMARQLDSGVLLTWRGAGHSVWEHGNECSQAAIDGYLDEGRVPADGTVC